MKSTERKNAVYENAYSEKKKLKQFLLKTLFVEKPKLRVEYLSQDESGSLEIFTTDSAKDKEENVRNKFSMQALSFFFVNCTKKLRFTHIYE